MTGVARGTTRLQDRHDGVLAASALGAVRATTAASRRMTRSRSPDRFALPPAPPATSPSASMSTPTVSATQAVVRSGGIRRGRLNGRLMLGMTNVDANAAVVLRSAGPATTPSTPMAPSPPGTPGAGCHSRRGVHPLGRPPRLQGQRFLGSPGTGPASGQSHDICACLLIRRRRWRGPRSRHRDASDAPPAARRGIVCTAKEATQPVLPSRRDDRDRLSGLRRGEPRPALSALDPVGPSE